MKNLIISAAIACGCVHFVLAEQVQNWFTGGVDDSVPTQENGAWESPAEGVVTNATSFTLDLGHEALLKFTPTANAAPDTNVMTRLVAVAKFIANTGALPTFSDDKPKTALIVSNTTYYAYTSAGDGSWVKLSGEADTDDFVILLAEVDYARSTPRVRYGVISGAETNYLAVADTEPVEEWIALAQDSTPDPALVGMVSFGGEGELTSVRGDVQLGLFENAGIKYGTADEAVAAAQMAGGDGTITILRNNDESVTIPSGSAIVLDTNGKKCGSIDNQSGQTIEIAVEVPAETVAKGSGTYTNDASVTGSANLTVTTSDSSKEAFGQLIEGGSKVEIVVRTAASVMNAVQFDGKAVADPGTAAYRTFLQTYCGDKDGAYMKANTTADAITTQLGENGSNGLPLWESYVLDLKPTDATSKPSAVVKPAIEDDSNMILTVPTYKATLPTSNYTVEYVLKNITDNTSTQIANPTAIAVPFDGKQYRVDTVIK